MKSWKLNLLRISVLLISTIVLSLCIFWLPAQANFFEKIAPEFGYMKYPLLSGLYITGIPFFIATFITFKLLKLIERDVAFTMDAIRYFKIIVTCAISEIVLYFGGLIYLYINNAMQPGIILLGLIIMFAAFLIAIFVEILKELLLKAVEIKNENELTI